MRRKGFLELKKNKIKLFSIIHKSSYISRNAILSDGVIVAPNCVIAPFAKIKENVLINSGAVVGHHSLLGLHSNESKCFYCWTQQGRHRMFIGTKFIDYAKCQFEITLDYLPLQFYIKIVINFL